jgi:hypothetical protein
MSTRRCGPGSYPSAPRRSLNHSHCLLGHRGVGNCCTRTSAAPHATTLSSCSRDRQLIFQCRHRISKPSVRSAPAPQPGHRRADDRVVHTAGPFCQLGQRQPAQSPRRPPDQILPAVAVPVRERLQWIAPQSLDRPHRLGESRAIGTLTATGMLPRTSCARGEAAPDPIREGLRFEGQPPPHFGAPRFRLALPEAPLHQLPVRAGAARALGQ